MEFKHIPIMLQDVVEFLNIKPNGIYVDCTVGGGGHSQEIINRLEGGRLIAIDKDKEALNACKIRFKTFPSKKIVFVHNDYKHLREILDELGIPSVDGILIDLGISSYQIDNTERGFSYLAQDAVLDMRMNREQQLTAKDIVNTYSEQRLSQILWDFGEEKFAKTIARRIVEYRTEKEICTCGELADIVDKSIPFALKRSGGHPAKRAFQALRAETNGELVDLKQTLSSMTEMLNVGGRMVVLTFHSLEDRIVKQVFVEKATGCICPPSAPICICNNKPKAKVLTKKPVTPSELELKQNSRSASCKLRALEKISE